MEPSSRSPGSPWKPTDALKAWLFVFAFVALARLARVLGAIDPAASPAPWLLVVGAQAVALALVWRMSRARRLAWGEATALRGPPSLADAAYAVLVAAATVTFSLTYAYALYRLGVDPIREPDIPKLFGTGWAGVLGVLAATVLFAPFAEEVLMRGLVLRGLLARLRWPAALLLSSAMFAVLHVDPLRMPASFAVGVGAGALLLARGSLWPCVFVHGLHNLAMLAISYATRGLPV